MKTTQLSHYLLLAASLFSLQYLNTACTGDEDLDDGTLTEVNATTNITADDLLGHWEGLMQDDETIYFNGTTYTYNNTRGGETTGYTYIPGSGFTVRNATWRITMFFNKRALVVDMPNCPYFHFMAQRDGLRVRQNPEGTWKHQYCNQTRLLQLSGNSYTRLEISGTEAQRISGTYRLDNLQFRLTVTQVESTQSFDLNTLTASSWEVTSTQREKIEGALLVNGTDLYCTLDHCVYTLQ